MGVDIDEAGLDVGDAMRIARRFRFREQGGALNIGGEHEIEQAGRAARRLLLDAAEPHLPRHRDRAGIGRKIAGDHVEQSGLAGAVAADEADMRAFRQSGGRFVEEDTRPEPEGQFIEMQHRRVLAQRAAMASAPGFERQDPR